MNVIATNDQLQSLISNAISNTLEAYEKKQAVKKIDLIDGYELCKRLGITIQTLIRWKAKGKLPYLQIGASIRYDYFKVLEALEVSNKKKGVKAHV